MQANEDQDGGRHVSSSPTENVSHQGAGGRTVASSRNQRGMSTLNKLVQRDEDGSGLPPSSRRTRSPPMQPSLELQPDNKKGGGGLLVLVEAESPDIQDSKGPRSFPSTSGSAPSIDSSEIQRDNSFHKLQLDEDGITPTRKISTTRPSDKLIIHDPLNPRKGYHPGENVSRNLVETLANHEPNQDNQREARRPGAVHVPGLDSGSSFSSKLTTTLSITVESTHGNDEQLQSQEEGTTTDLTTEIEAIPLTENDLEIEFQRRILERAVPARVVSTRIDPPLPKKWLTIGVTFALAMAAVVGLIVGLTVGLRPASSSSSTEQSESPCQGGSSIDVLLQCECFGEIQDESGLLLERKYVSIREAIHLYSNQSILMDDVNSTSNSCSADNLALWWLANDTNTDLALQQEVVNVERLFERFILVTFYLATGGRKWIEQGQWLTPDDVCNWNGVDCNDRETVSRLALPAQNLNGTVPDSLTQLTSLLVLALNNNELRGSFPHLHDVVLLETLDISHNQFEGSLPSLFDVDDLAEAALSLLENGSNLTLLDLYFDQTLIPFYRQHFNIKFSHNRFSGEMPLDHWLQTTLREYRIDSNQISGPFEINVLPEIAIRPEFLPYIASLTAADFTFIGRVPTNNEVEIIDISNNQFTGTLPEYLQIFTDFEYVNVSFNQFTSTIQPEIGNWREVETVDLSHNMLRGTLPKELANLSQLRFLYLSGNSFTGTFPNEICDAAKFLTPPRLNCTAVTGCRCCLCDDR